MHGLVDYIIDPCDHLVRAFLRWLQPRQLSFGPGWAVWPDLASLLEPNCVGEMVVKCAPCYWSWQSSQAVSCNCADESAFRFRGLGILHMCHTVGTICQFTSHVYPVVLLPNLFQGFVVTQIPWRSSMELFQHFLHLAPWQNCLGYHRLSARCLPFAFQHDISPPGSSTELGNFCRWHCGRPCLSTCDAVQSPLPIGLSQHHYIAASYSGQHGPSYL